MLQGGTYGTSPRLQGDGFTQQLRVICTELSPQHRFNRRRQGLHEERHLTAHGMMI